MKKRLVIGTRGSKLAIRQAHWTAAMLRNAFPACDIVIENIVTSGDKIKDVPLAKIGGKGLFTKEIELALLRGEIDLAVHSLKDIPTALPDGLILAAITRRVHAGDALVSPRWRTLANLPQGARVGTSSLRRRAQLLRYRPDLNITELRGNVDTRLKKLETESLDGIVLAVAGLERLGLGEHITEILPREICLPAVGQGALAIETRENDPDVRAMVGILEDRPTRVAVTAERALLAALEGGCQVPIGVYGQVEGDKLFLEAAVASLNGAVMVREKISGDPADPETLGRALAQTILARGGAAILSSLRMETDHA